MRPIWLVLVAACSSGVPDKATTAAPAVPPAPPPVSSVRPAVARTVDVLDKQFGLELPVAPCMTSKMAARLRAATTSTRPIHVRVDAKAGHGVGSTREQGFAERADVWSFFLSTFGEPGFVR